MSTRIVVGPVVVLPDATTGKTAYYYQGSELPAGLREDRVQDCIRDGLVREDLDVTELTIEDLSAAGAGDRLRAAETLGAVVDADGVEHVGELPMSSAVQRPKRTAPKAAWLAFRGVPEDRAEELTVEQLQDDELMDDWATRPAVPSA